MKTEKGEREREGALPGSVQKGARPEGGTFGVALGRGGTDRPSDDSTERKRNTGQIGLPLCPKKKVLRVVPVGEKPGEERARDEQEVLD